ncbi:MAG: DNA-formamidopyrimidine glycosylase family protein [Gemmatimonadota bacterium]
MPELPDVLLYIDALSRRLAGCALDGVAVKSPFFVRTFDPPLQAVVGRRLTAFRRLGKRIVWELEGDLYLVFHLMIAGRFHWRKAGARPARKTDLAAFHFAPGTLMVTEASSQKRASLHLVSGAAGLAAHDPGGLEVLDCSLEQFAAALRRENHTLKRALTDPRAFSGIGNAYSDEILHAARLSPFKWTTQLDPDEVTRLYEATRTVLTHWIEHLRQECGDAFPEKVTAFRPEMAVHGRCGQPCPVCGTAVQEIEYAANETNYCPRCQTGGKVLADRVLSKLLRDDWPRTIDELEARLGPPGDGQ